MGVGHANYMFSVLPSSYNLSSRCATVLVASNRHRKVLGNLSVGDREHTYQSQKGGFG